jgi:hypothetical protein
MDGESALRAPCWRCRPIVFYGSVSCGRAFQTRETCRGVLPRPEPLGDLFPLESRGAQYWESASVVCSKPPPLLPQEQASLVGPAKFEPQTRPAVPEPGPPTQPVVRTDQSAFDTSHPWRLAAAATKSRCQSKIWTLQKTRSQKTKIELCADEPSRAGDGGAPPLGHGLGNRKRGGLVKEAGKRPATLHTYRLPYSSGRWEVGYSETTAGMPVFACRRVDGTTFRADSARRFEAMRKRAACCRMERGLLYGFK